MSGCCKSEDNKSEIITRKCEIVKYLLLRYFYAESLVAMLLLGLDGEGEERPPDRYLIHYNVPVVNIPNTFTLTG